MTPPTTLNTIWSCPTSEFAALITHSTPMLNICRHYTLTLDALCILFSIITTKHELGSEYIFNVFLHSQVIGIILFPMVVCLQFSRYPIEWFLYPSMVIYILFFTLRTFRGFVIASSEQNSGFLYIILYFCALEILPLLVLVKFLVNHF